VPYESITIHCFCLGTVPELTTYIHLEGAAATESSEHNVMLSSALEECCHPTSSPPPDVYALQTAPDVLNLNESAATIEGPEPIEGTVFIRISILPVKLA